MIDIFHLSYIDGIFQKRSNDRETNYKRCRLILKDK